ncbi:MAG: LexA family transcriptional regulator, partial [Bacteroidetes bacterium]|nr:LexA family transcriptional regulator [Bacteroidota bacterium]
MRSIVTQRFITCHDILKEEGHVRSSRQFALSLDYLPQSLSEILKGRRDVTIELLRKAIEKYKISPVFIFSGEEPMFMSEEDRKSFRVLTVVTNTQDDEKIVHVPIPAQTGYAGNSADPSFIRDLPTYSLPDYKYKVGTHRSFDMAGDSMEPALFEGDKVICSYLDSNLWESSLKDNYVYVIVTKGDVMIRRVKIEAATNKLEIIPDNKHYNPQSVNMADIREIWHVRAKISPFLASNTPTRISPVLNKINELKEVISGQTTAFLDLKMALEEMNKLDLSEDGSPVEVGKKYGSNMKKHAIEGKVIYQNLGAGFWGIIDTDANKRRPVNMPDSLKKEGKKVNLVVEGIEEEL